MEYHDEMQDELFEYVTSNPRMTQCANESCGRCIPQEAAVRSATDDYCCHRCKVEDSIRRQAEEGGF